MIVHEDSHNVLTTVPVVKKSNRESKKFLIVNNHVREIPIQFESNSNSNEENSEQSAIKNVENSTKKNKKKKCNQNSINASREDTNISENDIEELRTVYRNCKAVIEKIEMKYGHLLHLDGEGSTSKQQKRKIYEIIEQCQCEKNKKIVFDDEGQQITVDTTIENHICPKKSKESHMHKNIEIQYTEEDIQLPDNLQELSKLLQNPNIENTFRNKVIYKIKSMKEEVSNEIKFNKYSLIEELKNNPDEILAFEGTNLASLPGYS